MKKRIFIFLSVLFFTSFFAGNWASAATFIDPVEVTPATANAWTDVDVSSYVPAGATGVMLHAVNTSTSALPFGFRNNGSTDNRTSYLHKYGTVVGTHGWCSIGIDENHIFELYVSHTTLIDVYLVGYFTDDAVFFTNAIDKSLSTTSAWTDVDVSADTGTDTAIGAIFEIDCSYNYRAFGMRNNGSTDNRTTGIYSHGVPGLIVGVDENEICEGYIAATDLDFWLVGYIVSNHIFYVNAVDYSIGTTDAWTDLSALPSGAKGGYIESVTYVGERCGMRKNGTSEDIYYGLGHHGWGLIECDANKLVEGKISATTSYFFLTGYPVVSELELEGVTLEGVQLGGP